jgi:nitroreductase
MTRSDSRQQADAVFAALRARRSVRAYAQIPVARDVIETLLDAAVRAPTAIHEEAWAFAVVQDKGLLQRLSDRAKPVFAAEMRAHGMAGHSFEHFTRPEFNIFHGASALVVICARPASSFAAADCWLAAENLMLAAVALSLGTCVIGSAVSALNLPESKADLGIPEDYSVVAPIAVGVPAGPTPATSRKPPQILSWKT